MLRCRTLLFAWNEFRAWIKAYWLAFPAEILAHDCSVLVEATNESVPEKNYQNERKIKSYDQALSIGLIYITKKLGNFYTITNAAYSIHV